MQLTPEQTATVAQWVNAGDSLSDIQTKIREEFSITMTYMDVRFLVDDLDLSLVDASTTIDPAEKKLQDELDAKKRGPEQTGGISLEVDNIMQPGALISGTVTFSDGEGAKWLIDQMGRPSLIPNTQGYRPSEEDIQSFQMELSRVIQEQNL